MKMLWFLMICLCMFPVFAEKTVRITSNIEKAEVFVDGFKAGFTPLELSETGVFSKGNHKVSVRAAGYQQVERDVQFFSTEDKLIEFRLEKAPADVSAPIMSSGMLWPVLGPLGLGGIAGWCVGYASKKMAKMAAIFIGIVFVCIQLLAFNDMITVNWGAITQKYDVFVQNGGPDSVFGAFMAVMTKNIPFAGAFAAGFFLGFKKG